MQYQVKAGESLSSIARDVLGDANRWQEIAVMNGIASPYVIHAGQVLQLPDSITGVDGVRHFQTGTQITAPVPASGFVQWVKTPAGLGVTVLVLLGIGAMWRR